jgi:hypothetical protein
LERLAPRPWLGLLKTLAQVGHLLQDQVQLARQADVPGPWRRGPWRLCGTVLNAVRVCRFFPDEAFADDVLQFFRPRLARPGAGVNLLA